MPIDLPMKLRVSLPLLLAAASFTVAGCSIHQADGGDGTGEPGSTDPSAPSNETASDPSGRATAERPNLRNPAPFERAGRYFVTGDDGDTVPLLTREELEATTRVHDAMVPPDVDVDNLRPLIDPPASYDLSAYQTPVKNQLDRGSCGTFATVGAIEAAYKRTYGATLDLSEQYMFHVSKSTGVSYPKIYQYENQSSYWYGGGWVDIAATYMLPAESLAPYAGYTGCASGSSCTPLNSIPGATALVWTADPATNTVTQKQVDDFEYSTLHIPAAARSNAIYGVASYSQYNSTQSRDTTLMESLISSNKEVVISVVTSWSDDDSNGILEYNSSVTGGGHVVLLIGYNRAQGYFLAKNSWGGTAPGAYLKLGYDFIRNASYGAATVNSVVPPSNPIQQKAKWIGKWYQDHEGWQGTTIVRRITSPTNAAVRLGTYYGNGSYASGHSVNGYSIDGNAGLRYYVASETENAPGTLTGQKFEADVYNWDPAHAAGAVWWDPSGEGGVHLGRSLLSMPYSSTFSTSEWVGTWDLNSNGTLGTLTINSVTPTTGDYVLNLTLLQGGVYKTVTGTLERARPGIAVLQVVNGSTTTTYRLHYHGWEDKLASGSATTPGATRIGAHAVRR